MTRDGRTESPASDCGRAFALAALAALLAVTPALPADPVVSSSLFDEFVLVAGDEVKVGKNGSVAGSVHGNVKVTVEDGAVVDGNASAEDKVDVKGTVTGMVTEGAPARTLPALPTEDDARALADRIFEDDVDWTDEVVDDVVFVDGKVKLWGSIGGTGTIIAAGDIEVMEVGAGEGSVLLGEGTYLTLIAFQHIKVLEHRSFRGIVLAQSDLILEKHVDFEGVAVGHKKVDAKEVVTARHLPPVADGEPPVISALTPSPDSLVSTPVPGISAAFVDEDSGVDPTTFVLLVDDVDVTAGAEATEAGFTFLPASPLADGAHQVAVSVADLAGNEAEVAWSFTVDATPPVLAFTAPESVVLGDATPEIAVTWSDVGSGVDLDSLEISLDGAPLEDCLVAADTATCEPPALEEGIHSLAAILGDQAGNVASAFHAFEIVLDLEHPVVVIEAPADQAMTNAPSIQVTGTATDDRSVVSVHVNGEPATLEGDLFSYELALGPGFNPILVVATDAKGKQGYESVAVTLDTQAPSLTLTSPAEGQPTNQPTVRVEGEADDDYEIALVTVSGQEVVPDLGRFATEVTLSPGPNELTVLATDRAGNAASLTRTVEYYSVPTVEITSPGDLAELTATAVDVSGAVSAGVASVRVNQVEAEVSGNTFVASGVPLVEGGNIVTATATDSAGLQATDSIHVVRDRTPPRVVVEHPLEGAILDEDAVTVWGLVNDIVSGTVNASEATVTVNGLPADVANRSFRVAGVPLNAGDNLLTVVATDAAGNTAEAGVTVHRATEPVARIRAVSGDGQTAVIGEPLPEPLVVEVLDAAGNPVAGETVVLKVKGGDGTLDGGARRIAVTTDAAGRAQTTFTLGHRSGLGNQRVEALAVGYAGPAMFSAIALPAPALEILLDAGGLQVGVTGQALPRPLIAAVTDAGHNRLGGVPVTFTVAKGLGTFPDGSTEITIETDSDGRAITPYVLGPDEGMASDVVEARIAGLADSPVVGFVATAKAAGHPDDTAILGVVLDNTDAPVEGVTIRVRDTALTAVTDAQGQFSIEGAPVGAIQLIVDGSTANRPGTWPDLEYELVTIPGRDNTVNTPIYLLPIDVANGLWVDETTGGTLTLPDLPGFALEVAPGSVTFPIGGHSGTVSVTAVHYDKVPMTPNFGQQPRLIVTIQPANARFEPPARITLPNVEGLAPGAVTEMYSFDHDLGHFVSIGPATVSDDGSTMTSNPGVGIVKAGWHCGGDPAVSGTTHACPDCQFCDGTTCVAGCPLEESNDTMGLIFASSGSCCGPGGDGKQCTFNDRCEGGVCQGDKLEVRSVELFADSQKGLAIQTPRTVEFFLRIDPPPVDLACPVNRQRALFDFGDGDAGVGEQCVRPEGVGYCVQHEYTEFPPDQKVLNVVALLCCATAPDALDCMECGEWNDQVQITEYGVRFRLELVEPIKISTDGKFTEDARIKVTAIRTDTRQVAEDWSGAVPLEEDGTAIYAENTAYGAKLPASVTLTNGVGEFVAKSLAGPEVRDGKRGRPAPARITVGSGFELDGPPLEVEQWVRDEPPTLTLFTANTYDWLEARVAAIHEQASGEVQEVLQSVTSYAVEDSLGTGCGHTSGTGVSIAALCEDGYRIDGPSASSRCGLKPTKSFTALALHEARHAYQHVMSQRDDLGTGGSPRNNSDGDCLPEVMPIAPNILMADVAEPRTICQYEIDGVEYEWTPAGDDVADDCTASANGPDGPGWDALQMDAETFAVSNE